MTDAASQSLQGLAAECRVFTRYLTRTEATPYVLDKYRSCHRSLHVPSEALSTWFDGFLLALARLGPFGTGLVDTYSRWFAPRSVMRHKLALLLAVLEHSPEFYRPVTSARVGARWTVLGSLALTGLREAAFLLMGVALLAPLHLVAGLTRRHPR